MLKNLEDIDLCDKPLFGCKAYYLGKLIRDGFNVPKGFALTDSADYIDVGASGLWAVRSSGYDEDQEQGSMAGHYQSYLNVRDLSSTISRCFRENQVASVIAQQMIETDFGGVCFSSRREAQGAVHIEFCLGHNSGVTQGMGKIARVAMASGAILNADDAHGLIHQVPMAMLSSLAEQALEIEKNFGFPIDIEWCVRGTELFILQARPITGMTTCDELEDIKAQTLSSLQAEVSERGFGLWTDFSIGDMFRHPSRLFLDLVNHDHGSNWSVRQVYRDLGLKPASKLKGPLFVSICDRAYINVGNYFDFLFSKSVFVPSKSGLNLRRGAKSWSSTLAHMVRLFGVPFHARTIRRSMYQRYSSAKLDQLISEARVISRRDYADMSFDELFAAFNEVTERLSGEVIYAHLMSDVLAGASHSVLRACLRLLFKKEAESWENSLTTGLEHNFNTQTTLALHDVAQGTLSLDAFLEAFGHRGSPDWEISSKRWREEPEKIRKMAQAMRASEQNVRDVFEGQVAIREKAERELVEYLKKGWVRRLFKPLVLRQLHYFQVYSPLREQTQSVVYAFIEALRVVILAIGEKAGLGERVFALSRDEFYTLPSLSNLVPKDSQHLARRVYMPHLFDASDLKSDLFRLKTTLSCEHMLKGVSVSRGVVVGKARVVDDLSQATDLNSDEIVVAKFADPSYASHLLCAGGLVLEQGSVFSHTAIIAREFGLPAIVNVEHATHLIKTGQGLRLDAECGELWIEPQGTCASSPFSPMT